jgi:hypothetical protein
MKSEMGLTTGWILGVFGTLLVGVSVFSIHAEGQQGNNAVYYYVSSTNPGQCCKASPAFFDASMFISNATNFCGVLNYMLNPSHGIIPSIGAVIDARGLNSGNTSMTCMASPWAGISSPPPSTILLPATTASTPISIPTPWILPNNTRLIGEGDNDPSSATPLTTIQASSSFSGNMIQFGSSSVCPSGVCTGISVENLTLDGQGGSINGIVNQYSQDFSYVDHVSLYQIRGTGLSASGSANNSGPYSNITFDLGSISGLSSTTRARIVNASGTHAIPACAAV